MRTRRLRSVVVLAALLAGSALAAPPKAGGPVLYRWKDARGVLQLGNVLPPAAAQGGYEVLDARTLKPLRVIAPAATPAELEVRQQAAAAQAAQEAAAKEAAATQQAAAAEQARRDAVLVNSYGSVEELERSRDQQLETLRLITEAAQLTVTRLQGNLADMERAAQEYRASGKPVPARLTQNMAETQGRITRQQGLAERNQAQEVELRARYATDVARFRELNAARDAATPP